MVITLWIIMFYLMIGLFVYQSALDTIEKEDPTAKFSELNNIMLLMVAFLWLPILICSLFSE